MHAFTLKAETGIDFRHLPNARPCAHGLTRKLPENLRAHPRKHTCDGYAQMLDNVGVYLPATGGGMDERVLVATPYYDGEEIVGYIKGFAAEFDLEPFTFDLGNGYALVVFARPASMIAADLRVAAGK